jgi:hypothetical protein
MRQNTRGFIAIRQGKDNNRANADLAMKELEEDEKAARPIGPQRNPPD